MQYPKKELREAEGSTTVFSAAIMDLFTQDLSLDDLANLPLKDLAEWLQSKGRGRFKDPEGLAKRSNEPSVVPTGSIKS
ncbi:hypothetical protein GCM10025879_21630 [Leuconostoc litchii]|nr:hypothetical protein GCM10025879_21630 [Leuconostoc litchii]